MEAAVSALPSLSPIDQSCLDPLALGLVILCEHLDEIELQIIPTLDDDRIQLLLGRSDVPVVRQLETWNQACHTHRLEEDILLLGLLDSAHVSFFVVEYVNRSSNRCMSWS